MNDIAQRYGDFGTPEQLRKGGRTMLGSKRGETKRIYVLSVMDVLVDYGILSDAQRDCGNAYWRLKEIALPMLGVATNPVYGGIYHDEQHDAPSSYEHELEDGMLTKMYLEINGRIMLDYIKAVEACLRTEDECPATTIVQVFGENTLVSAFEKLEQIVAEVRKELLA